MRRWVATTAILLLLAGAMTTLRFQDRLFAGSTTEVATLLRQLSEVYPAVIRQSERVDAVFAQSPHTQDAPTDALALFKETDRVGRLAAKLQESIAAYAARNEQAVRWNMPLTESAWSNWMREASPFLHDDQADHRFAATRVTPFLRQWQPATDLYDAWANMQWDLQHLQVTMAVLSSTAAVLSQRETPGIVPSRLAGQIDQAQQEIIDLSTQEAVPWGAVLQAAGKLRDRTLQGLKYAPDEPRLLALYQLASLVEWAAHEPPQDLRTITGVRWWSYLLALESLGSLDGQVYHDSRLIADARSFMVKGTVHETALQRVARGAVIATDFLIPDPTIVSKGSKVYKAAKKAYLIGGDVVLATKGGKKIAKGLDDAYKLVDGGLDLKNVWDIAQPFVMGGIPGVHIDVHMDRTRALEIITGNDGHYETPALVPSSYQFRFEHEKYEPTSLNVVAAPYWQNAYVDGVAVPFADGATVEVDVALEKRTVRALADHGLNLAGAVVQGGGIFLCVVGIAGAIETFGVSLLLCGAGAGVYAGGSKLQELADDQDSEFAIHDYRDESQKPRVPVGSTPPYAEFRAPPKAEPDPGFPVLRAMPVLPGTTSTVFVLDVSPSMNESAGTSSRLKAAREAIQSLIQVIAFDAQETNRPHRVGVVVFGGSAQRLHGLDAAYADAIRALENVANISATNVGDGLATGLAELAYAPGSRTLILLTDGQTNQGMKPEEIVAGPASRAASEGITVHTVGFGVDDDLLAQIAARTGGDYVSIEDSFNLQRHYLKLRHQAQGRIIGDFTGEVEQGETKALGTVEVGSGDMHATLTWPGSNMDLVLVDPTGRTVDTRYPGARLLLDSRPKQILVQDPLPGQWAVKVIGAEVPPGGEPFSVILSQRPQPTASVIQGIIAVASVLLVLCYFAFLKQEL